MDGSLMIVLRGGENWQQFLNKKIYKMEDKEFGVFVTMRRIDKKRLEQRDFPCMCVPLSFGGGNTPDKYMWEHAGVVDSVIRGAAHYFEIKTVQPVTDSVTINWAKQDAIDFVKWKDEKGYVKRLNPDIDYPEWGWRRQENQIIWSKWINDSELYQLYKNKPQSNV